MSCKMQLHNKNCQSRNAMYCGMMFTCC